MKKILLSFLVVVLSSIAAYAQGQLFGTTLDLKETASPGNPNTGYRRVRVDSSGVVYIRQNNGTEVSVLTSSINTDLVTEGSTNLYHTTSRVRAALSAGTGVTYNSGTGEIAIGQAVATGSSPTFAGLTLTGLNGVLKTSSGVVVGSATTDDLTEGSNLYFTNTRARSALSAGSGITYNSTTGEISATGGGGSGALSALTAATGSNDINNANNAQIWRWNTLAGTTGLQLASSSTAAASNAQVLFDVALSGANSNSTQTTIAARIANTHTGTSSTNIGLSLTASGGTNNYALLIPSGRVGIGTSTTTATIGFGTTLALKTLNYYESGNTVHGAGVISGATVTYYPTGGRASFGAISTGDGSTYTEKAFINDTRLDLTGASQNLTFSGNGGIILGGGTTLNAGSKISFGSGVNAQAFTIYHNGNTKHYIGLGASQTIIAHPTGAKTSIGAVSSSDGTTFTSYFDFNDNGKLDITQGTITTNKPYINHTVTTNEGSTQFILDDSTWADTASASTSLFSRKRVGSTVMYSLRKDGFGYFAGNIGANITSPSVIINPFDSPTAGTIIQSAGFVSSQRTGQVGFHMFNGGGVAEWIVTQPASGTSNNFQINKVVSNTQTKLFELTTDGDLKIPVGGLFVAEGTNKSMGVATLSSGTVTVNTTKVTANSRIFLTKQGSATKHGILVVSARTAGTSFTITSIDGADGTATQTGDDGQVAWQIIEPN